MTKSFLFGSRYLNYQLNYVYDSWLFESIGTFKSNIPQAQEHLVYVDRNDGCIYQNVYVAESYLLGKLQDILSAEQLTEKDESYTDWEDFIVDYETNEGIGYDVLVTKQSLEWLQEKYPHIRESDPEIWGSLFIEENGDIYYRYIGHKFLISLGYDDKPDRHEHKFFIFETDMTMETDPKVYLENYERVQAYHHQEWCEIGLFIYRNALDGENYSLESDKMDNQYLFDKLRTSGLVKPTTQIDAPTIGCYAFHAPLYHHEDLDNYEMECGKIAEIDGLHFVFEDGRRVYINKGWIYFNEQP